MAFKQVDNVRNYKFTFSPTIPYHCCVRRFFQWKMIMCFRQSYFARVCRYIEKYFSGHQMNDQIRILLISGENALEYWENSSKKVNKSECSVNLSLTSSLMSPSLDNFSNFFLFSLLIFFIFFSKWINKFTNHSLKFSLSLFFSNWYRSSQNLFQCWTFFQIFQRIMLPVDLSLYFV